MLFIKSNGKNWERNGLIIFITHVKTKNIISLSSWFRMENNVSKKWLMLISLQTTTTKNHKFWSSNKKNPVNIVTVREGISCVLGYQNANDCFSHLIGLHRQCSNGMYLPIKRKFIENTKIEKKKLCSSTKIDTGK